VATSLSNLAGIYGAQGQYEKAEPLYERALAISEQALGPDHPNVATSLNNLARLLQATNRLSEAEPLMQRSIVILLKSTRLTGHLHPSLRTVFSNYYSLLTELRLSQEEIGYRLAELELVRR
jgi:tetratricopeptide (TPR) repeat protein